LTTGHHRFMRIVFRRGIHPCHTGSRLVSGFRSERRGKFKSASVSCNQTREPRTGRIEPPHVYGVASATCHLVATTGNENRNHIVKFKRTTFQPCLSAQV